MPRGIWRGAEEFCQKSLIPDKDEENSMIDLCDRDRDERSVAGQRQQQIRESELSPDIRLAERCLVYMFQSVKNSVATVHSL
jgi:hypothetical protein